MPRLRHALLIRSMAANPPSGLGREAEKIVSEPVTEKPEDTHNEYETSSQVLRGDEAGSVSVLPDDAHTKALTRKLLWKLDTRYAPTMLWEQCSMLNSSIRLESFPFSPSFSSAPFSIGQMWATPKSSVSKRISV